MSSLHESGTCHSIPTGPIKITIFTPLDHCSTLPHISVTCSLVVTQPRLKWLLFILGIEIWWHVVHLRHHTNTKHNELKFTDMSDSMLFFLPRNQHFQTTTIHFISTSFSFRTSFRIKLYLSKHLPETDKSHLKKKKHAWKKGYSFQTWGSLVSC